jgi:Transglutaminase-like superfamily
LNVIFRRRGYSESLSASNADVSPGRGESIRRDMPDTDEGIRQIQIPKMVQYVREFSSDPLVVKTARRVVELCRAKDRVCEMQAIFLWSKAHMRYVSDTVNKEVIATAPQKIGEMMMPPEILRAILGESLIRALNGEFGVGESLLHRTNQLVCKGCFIHDPSAPEGLRPRSSGDCDEACVLLATMLAAIGIPPRFRLGGMPSSKAPDGCSYHHIWTQAQNLDSGEWVDMDITEEKSTLGWSYPHFGCTGIVTIYK